MRRFRHLQSSSSLVRTFEDDNNTDDDDDDDQKEEEEDWHQSHCKCRTRFNSKSSLSSLNIRSSSRMVYYVILIVSVVLLHFMPNKFMGMNSLEIISPREPGEATSSLIQHDGLTANITTLGELINLSSSSPVLAAAAEAAADRDNQQQQKPALQGIINLINNQTLETNKSSNTSSTNESLDNEEQSLVVRSIIEANKVIFVIGLCGNAVVILVILKFTRIETVTDIYILNLAFADLMFITGLIFLITTMIIEDWIFGNLMCKIYMASTSLNQFASSLLLVVMSFDRFLAVCHPIYAQRFRQLKRAKLICLGIWIICLILMTPIFAFAKTDEKKLTCAIYWPEIELSTDKGFNCDKAFTLYSFAIGFAVPLSLIAAFYFCVIRKLRMAASGPISMGSTRRSRSRENTNRRIEHLVIGIICTYTICWLPYWITQLCVSFVVSTDGHNSPVDGFYEFVLIATSLSYTNSALNPILYAFLSDNFKRRCSEIFRSICSIKLFQQYQGGGTNHHQPVACNESEISRPESRQTVVLNESIRLAPSPITIRHKPETSCASIGADSIFPTNQHSNESVADRLDLPLMDNYGNKSVLDVNNQRKKSVAFNVDTIVVQGIKDTTNNHKIQQRDDNINNNNNNNNNNNFKCQGV